MRMTGCVSEVKAAWDLYRGLRGTGLALAAIWALLHCGAAAAFAQAPGLSVITVPSGPAESTTSFDWVDCPGMEGEIAVPAGGNLRIAFSAEASTSSGSARMFVRALVDGQPASPSDVLFVSGTDAFCRDFTFVAGALAAGVHQVRIQWSVDSGGKAYVGDRTLTLLAAPEVAETGGLSVIAPASGPDVTTTSAAFSDIPGMVGSVVTAGNANLAITVSAEAAASSPHRMFLRTLVDGQPAAPSSVVFAASGDTGVHSYTFTAGGLSAGVHTVQTQWSVDGGGTASAGDRTLVLFSYPEAAGGGGLTVTAPPSGPAVTTTALAFSDVPGLSAAVETADGGLLQITVSAEVYVSGPQRMGLRTLVDGQPASPSDIILSFGAVQGIRSFTFAADGLSPGVHTVQVQWRVDSGGTASLGDRTLVLTGFPPQVITMLPAGTDFFEYPATEWAEVNSDPSLARPIGLGPVASGGGEVTIDVRLGYFRDPVDCYFGIYSEVLGEEILMLRADNTFAPLSQGLVPWLTGTVGPLEERILGQVPVALFPKGTYLLGVMVTPQGSQSSYFFWVTSFEIL